MDSKLNQQFIEDTILHNPSTYFRHSPAMFPKQYNEVSHECAPASELVTDPPSHHRYFVWELQQAGAAHVEIMDLNSQEIFIAYPEEKFQYEVKKGHPVDVKPSFGPTSLQDYAVMFQKQELFEEVNRTFQTSNTENRTAQSDNQIFHHPTWKATLKQELESSEEKFTNDLVRTASSATDEWQLPADVQYMPLSPFPQHHSRLEKHLGNPHLSKWSPQNAEAGLSVIIPEIKTSVGMVNTTHGINVKTQNEMPNGIIQSRLVSSHVTQAMTTNGQVEEIRVGLSGYVPAMVAEEKVTTLSEGKERVCDGIQDWQDIPLASTKKYAGTTIDAKNTTKASSADIIDMLLQCRPCHKVFTKASYLKQHIKASHGGHKPFRCEQCGKKFGSDDTRKKHLEKHVGDKPYKCDVCPKQFNYNTDLKRHVFLHTGQKPHACPTCGKGFVRKDHMVNHYKKHSRKPQSEI